MLRLFQFRGGMDVERKPIQFVNETKLCNLLPYGNYGVIDARPAEIFELDAILGSINCPPPRQNPAENEGEDEGDNEKRTITMSWLIDNCISIQNREKFQWLPHLKTILVGENETDPWIRNLYEIFLTANFTHVPEFVNIMTMKQHYPLLFTPKGESITFKKFRYPTEIIPNFLWLGSVESAQDRRLIESLGITHIVNATIRSRRNFFPDIVKYLTVDVLDEVTEDMSNFFQPVNDFISTAEKEQGRVLVHCQAGISRSASLTINYLRVRNQWTLKDALEYVTQQRPEVHPNKSFMEQLIQQEALANPEQRTSIDINDIGTHGGVKEKVIRRMTSSNSSLSIDASEMKSVSSLRDPLVSISEATTSNDHIGKKRPLPKKSNCCCVIS
jgi:predicted protein tyrosine phosphatase